MLPDRAFPIFPGPPASRARASSGAPQRSLEMPDANVTDRPARLVPAVANRLASGARPAGRAGAGGAVTRNCNVSDTNIQYHCNSTVLVNESQFLDQTIIKTTR